jgi:cytoskeletal protein CcmA (bactofilin family)
LSVIAAGTTITGELSSDGTVKVEGIVVGSVRAERQVLVAKGGRIDGDVYTREAIVGGEVRGAILADDRVEVQATSVIQGDITTQRIVVQEGGEVNGHVKMTNPNALEIDSPPAVPERPPRVEES